MANKASILDKVVDSWEKYRIVPEELGSSALNEVLEVLESISNTDPVLLEVLNGMCR